MPENLNHAALKRLLGRWQNDASPAYCELAERIRLLIMDGRIALDTGLPSERALAEALGLSRTTITGAYARLREQGFLCGSQGSRGRTRIPQRHADAGIPCLTARDDLIDLAYASLPACGEAVHRAYANALTELPAVLPTYGYEAMGMPALREAIAGHYRASGIATQADQILVTTGAQHAFNVVARTMLQRNDRIFVDAPTYPNVLDAIRNAGFRAHPIALLEDKKGEWQWDIDTWCLDLASAKPKLAYLIPDFHNPTGALMPDRQRAKLARAARASGTYLLVDETMRALNLDGHISTPMAAYGPHVISIGSLSKSHWAGLRLGWVRADAELIQRMVLLRASMDLGNSLCEQLAATHLIRDFAAPMRARLAMLRRHRRSLLGLMAEHLPDWHFKLPKGGLSIWCRLPSLSSSALTTLAPGFGVQIAAGPRFGPGGAFDECLRIPYALPPEGLENAIIALRNAQDELQRRRRSGSPPRSTRARNATHHCSIA